MLQSVKEPNSPVNDHDLNLFSKRHSITLPQSYREFLLHNNGGRPIPPAFYIAGFQNNPEGVIQAFFGLKADIATEDLDRNVEELSQSVPHGVLPIARTDGADFVCLDLRKPGVPVMFWDRVPFWGSNTWNEKDLYPVADSFEALLEDLHEFVP